MKINYFFGFKIKQTQTFDQQGKRLAVTLIKTAPLKISQIKKKDKDGYSALKVELAKGLSSQKQQFKEIRLEQEGEFKVGDEITVEKVFKVGDKIAVTGKTKGKGFSGVVKRWGFAGGPRTHGQSDRQRAPGSIGQRTDPGRVWKGKKMPGRMGNKQKTIKGLTVFKLDEKKNELWATGLVPGRKGGLLKISKLG